MVYFKIDNFTCMIDNTSIHDIFEIFQIPEAYFPDFINNSYETLLSGVAKLVIHEHGIHISLNGDEYRMASYYDDEFELLNYKFRSIRVELSGSGLDFLRNELIDIDSMLINQDFIESHCIRSTRCDFAFDFINCYPVFLDTLANELFDIQMNGKNILTPAINKGNNHYSYEICFGRGVKCIYLGATKGLRFLRIYDKLLEQTNPSGILKKPLPNFEYDDHVDTWFRVELQTRKKYCEKYLCGCDENGEAVLKEIFKDFRVRNGSQPLKSIEDFMDWDRLPELRKMKIQSNPEQTVATKSANWFTKNRGNILVYLAINGFEKFLKELLLYVSSMRDGSTSGVFKELNFNKRINQHCIEQDLILTDLPYIDKDPHNLQLFLPELQKLYSDILNDSSFI